MFQVAAAAGQLVTGLRMTEQETVQILAASGFG
jgi:hypothetical protein